MLPPPRPRPATMAPQPHPLAQASSRQSSKRCYRRPSDAVRLGEHKVPSLRFRRARELPSYDAKGLHVRNRRHGGGCPRRHERKASVALTAVPPQFLKDFAAFNVNDAKPDRLWRPLGLARRIDGRSSVSRSNFDITKRSALCKVANTKFVSSSHRSGAVVRSVEIVLRRSPAV
jgi:hypothetical protein